MSDLLVVEEYDPLVEARNEASVIVFEGLARYAAWAGVEPALEGETAKFYRWATGGRCGHPYAFESKEHGFCTLCGWCWHRRIVRENPGARNEIQFCDWCGEEKTDIWRGGEDTYEAPSYHGF